MVDHDLTPHDRRRLEHRLEVAVDSTDPLVARLAGELLELTRAGAFNDAVEPRGRVRRRLRQLRGALQRRLTHRRMAVLLAVGTGLLGLATLADLAFVGLVAADVADGSAVADAVDRYVDVDVLDQLGVVLFACRIGLDGVLGVLFLVSAVLLARGRDERGAWLAGVSLLGALLTADVLFFWSEQFAAAAIVLVHLLLLACVRHHQRTLEEAG